MAEETKKWDGEGENGKTFNLIAVGCPDLNPAANSWFIRSGDSLTIKCNSTKEVYQWTCRDNRWTGDTWNCSTARLGMNIEKLSNSAISISYGISLLMILIIALTIGIFVLISGLVFLKRRNERSRIVMIQHGHSPDSTTSDKQYYSTSLVRNLAGSVVLQSEKMPWNDKDDTYHPPISRCYAPYTATEKSMESPLLSTSGFSPPPYCQSRRRLPCGCEAYVDACATPSASGQDMDGQSGRRDDDVNAIYYVLDPQKHAAHRRRSQGTTTTTQGHQGPRTPETVEGRRSAVAWSFVDDDDISGVRSRSDVTGQDVLTPSKYPEVVSDCELSIQNEAAGSAQEVQFGNTL